MARRSGAGFRAWAPWTWPERRARRARLWTRSSGTRIGTPSSCIATTSSFSAEGRRDLPRRSSGYALPTMGKFLNGVLWIAALLAVIVGAARLVAIRWWQIPDNDPIVEASIAPTLRGGDWVLLWRVTPP